MTRGNQRDLARAKNAKKNAKGKTTSEQEGNKGMNLTERKERDAIAMRLKQEKAASKQAGEGSSEKK